jgi:hypothetical protein
MSTSTSLGIMQPYFFPYWGHFALIAVVDRWVVFDNTQYTKKSWMTRNRILHPLKGWQYVTVPLDGASISIKTCEARILNPAAVGSQIVRKLMHYKKRAPFYSKVIELVERVFFNLTDDKLVTLNTLALVETCRYLGIPFNYQICSHLDLDYPENIGSGDWAPTIASQLKVSAFVNPASGKNLFEAQRFANLGIELVFLEVENFAYPTPGYHFETNLSIIDVMMWNDPESIRLAFNTLTKLKKC